MLGDRSSKCPGELAIKWPSKTVDRFVTPSAKVILKNSKRGSLSSGGKTIALPTSLAQKLRKNIREPTEWCGKPCMTRRELENLTPTSSVSKLGPRGSGWGEGVQSGAGVP